MAKFFKIPLINIPLSLCGIFNGLFMGYISGVIFDIVILFLGLWTSFNVCFVFLYGLIGTIPAIINIIFSKYLGDTKINKKTLLNIFIVIFLIIIIFLGLIEILNFQDFYKFLTSHYSKAFATTILFWFFFLLLTLFVLTIIFWKKSQNDYKNANIYLVIFLSFIFEYLIISLFLKPIFFEAFYNVPYKVSYLNVLTEPIYFFLAMFAGVFFYSKLKNYIF